MAGNKLISPDDERAVLGCILKDYKALDRIIEIITSPAEFGVPAHRAIYEAVAALDVESEHIDSLTVADKLRDSGGLDAVGGAVYVANLADHGGSAAAVHVYAQRVHEYARRRQGISAAKKFIESCRDTGASFEDTVDAFERSLATTDDSRIAGSVTVEEVARSQIERLVAGQPLVDRSQLIPTRIEDLNRKLGGGLFKGDSVVVAGPPSMGKTSFALDLCVWNATHGRNSLYFPLDETQRAMGLRLIASETGLPVSSFHHTTPSVKGRERLQVLYRSLESRTGHVYLDEGLTRTAAQIRASARTTKRRHGLEIVVVDYLGRVAAPEDMKRASRTEVVSENSRLLDGLAKELDILVVVVSQLNRDYNDLPFNPGKGKYGIPTQSMLRDSGQIEADANVILFPFRLEEARRKRGLVADSDFEEAGEMVEDAIVMVSKNKIGSTGPVKAKFNGSQMRFYSGSARGSEPGKRKG